MNKKTYEERLYDMTKQYTVQDVERLLDAEIDAAGLVLAPIFSGMVALGHVLYGFGLTDREAFLEFARHRMKLPVMLAKVLYDNVRYGLNRQWSSQSRIRLYVFAKGSSACWVEKFTYKLKDKGVVGVDAGPLAKRYIQTVAQLPEYTKTERHKSETVFDEWREQVAELYDTIGE